MRENTDQKYGNSEYRHFSRSAIYIFHFFNLWKHEKEMLHILFEVVARKKFLTAMNKHEQD